MNITLYKVFNYNGKSIHIHSGNSYYSLPTTDKPGDWMPPRRIITPCSSGYHLCRGAKHLLHWFGPEIWGVEVRGKVIEENIINLVVCESMRFVACVNTWDKKTARMFVADCAEHVLPIFEREHPHDLRPRRAI